MKKILAIVIIVVLLVSLFAGLVPSSVVASPDWIIDGDKVYVEETWGKLEAYPHTISSSGWVYFNATPYQDFGELDFYWGFNTTSVKPIKAEFYKPHYVNWTTQHSQFFYNVSSLTTTNESCGYGNDYNHIHRNATYQIWNFSSEQYETTTAIGCFDSYEQEGTNYTIYWHTNHTRIDNWIQQNTFQLEHTIKDFEGYNEWWHIKNFTVEVDKTYQARAYIDVPITFEGTSEKYYFAVKRSSETLDEAIATGHFMALDPWIEDSGWLYRKTINITGQSGAGTHYQVNFSIGDSSGGDFHLEGHCTDFPNDTVVTDNDGTTKLPFWIENASADPIQMWVNVTDNLNTSQDICVYYGKSGESSASNGTNTFLAFFDGDPTGWTEVDPNSHISFANNRLGFAGLTRSESAYVYKGITPIEVDWVAEWTMHLSAKGAAAHVFGMGISSEIDDLYSHSGDSVGVDAFYNDAVKDQMYIWEVDEGSASPESTSGTTAPDTRYMRAYRTGDMVYLTAYSDAARASTIEATISKDITGVTPANLDNYYLLSSLHATGSAAMTGYVDDHKCRKYVSTEPAFSSAGEEESSPTYIPPNPTTLQNTTGNFWVNYTWDAGSGNVTNSYNVSNQTAWFNGTINTYYNVSVGANEWINITVYAWNSSGSGALSAGSVSDQVQGSAADTTFTVSLPVGYTKPVFEPPNSTATNYPPNGQTDSQEFFNVTNSGNVNLDVRMRLNTTVSTITLKADSDNNPSGAKEVNTTMVTIYSGLGQGNSVNVWLWSDFDHTPTQTANRTVYINVSQT